MNHEIKKKITAIGWRYALLFVVTIVVELIIGLISGKIWPSMSATSQMNVSLFSIVIAVDVIGFILISFLMRKIPTDVPKHNKISAGKYILGIFVLYALIYSGSAIGTVFQTMITGSSSSALNQIMSDSNIFLQVLVIGILAPIFEELIFRKLLCGALSHYGKLFAILVSALAFGLYHGNFSQFFYATFLGLFFGYIYLKTGNIIYTIGYHLIVNLSSSLITNPLAMKSSTSNTFATIYAAWLIFQVLMALAGVIIIIIFIRRIHINDENSEIKGKGILKAMFGNPGLWLTYFAGISLFVYSIVTSNTSATSKIVNDIQFTEVVTVTNSQVDTQTLEIPITLEESGMYEVKINFYDNQAPSFVTGVLIETSDGQGIEYMTGNLANFELIPREYEAGEYRIVFYFLSNEEDALEFVNYIGN